MIKEIKEGIVLSVLTSAIIVLGLFDFFGLVVYILSGIGVCKVLDHVDSILRRKHRYYDGKREQV